VLLAISSGFVIFNLLWLPYFLIPSCGPFYLFRYFILFFFLFGDLSPFGKLILLI